MSTYTNQLRKSLNFGRFSISYIVCFWTLLSACESASTDELVAPEVPQLSVDQPVRGTFLGVWGSDTPNGQVWFVGGEVLNQTESHRLIAKYVPNLETDDPTSTGTLKLVEESDGGVLWWIWGSGLSGEVWASGEQGTILKLVEEGEESHWIEESVLIDDELKDKLIIWGLWGHVDTQGQSQVWGVGGSVRRGGPKGVLLKRNTEGKWERMTHALLPIESADDPIQGRNLYKIWGNQEQVWMVGEGSITLNAKLSQTSQGLSLTDWQNINMDGDRPELLFTVVGDQGQKQHPWLVGGLAEGKAWRWSPNTQNQGIWSPVSLPPTPALNGISVSDDLVIAVGSQGVLLAWEPDIALDQPQRVHHQWIKGAESMTLHSTWASPAGDFWIVGGDLTTFQSGVIIPPQAWSIEQSITWESW